MNDNLATALRESFLRGQQAHASGDFATARSAYLEAARLAPGHEAVLSALAALAMDTQDWAGAETLLRSLDAAYPGKYRPRLALTIFNQHRHAEALPLLQSLIDAGQTDIACILAYAACLERTGEEQRCIKVLEQVYAAVPTSQYAVHLASALKRLHQRELLDKRLPELLAEHPGDPVLLATLSEHRLAGGDYAEGFALAGHRWEVSLETAAADELACEPWDGVVFPGLLLVTAEQGLGDEILASSLFADLLASGQRALVACEPRLLPVFRRSFPGLLFTDRHGGGLQDAVENNDCRTIPALELGRWFRRGPGDFPVRTRWLESDPVRREAFRQMLTARFPGQRLTGLSWRSTRVLLGDAKSIPLSAFAPLLREPATAFIDLQYGDTRAERAQLLADTGLTLHKLAEPDTTQDIDGLFALIDALDDVVSSSNTNLHIAGALGKPTTALVPGTRYALWYWGYSGATTPWYPSLVLHRGPSLETWEKLIADIAAARAAAGHAR